MVLMAGFKQPKRVSWARDGNLCKVRLFLSEDAPCQSGFQDQLQAKASWLQHAVGLSESEDSLPPGFEKHHDRKHQSQINTSQIPIIKWQCPLRLSINPDWLVVAGDESQELAIENNRQLGVLEAIYPRSSFIPPNPSSAPEARESSVSDSQTPLIPITAIEDEDTVEEPDESVHLPTNEVAETPRHVTTQQQPQTQPNQVMQPPNIPQPNQVTQPPNIPQAEHLTIQAAIAAAMASIPPGAEPDVVAAATAALTAIISSSAEGSLVDHDLLIKILSDPTLMEKLQSRAAQPNPQPKQNSPPMPPPHHAASTSAVPPPHHAASTSAVPPPHQAASISAVPPPRPFLMPPVLQYNTTAPSMRNPSPLPFVPPPSHTQLFNHINPMPVPVPRIFPPPSLNMHHSSLPVRKDVNYYKSLIQLHGGDKHEVRDPNIPFQFNHVAQSSAGGGGMHEFHRNNMMDVNVKPRVAKPCVYFNTPRGCRNGASCLFQHEGLVPQRVFEQQKGSAKRIKLDRE